MISIILQGKGINSRIWGSIKAYLFLLPLFAGLIIFCYYPPISGVYHSFFDWNDIGSKRYIGFANYVELFKDKVFLGSIPTAFKLLLPRLAIGTIVPLIMAEMIYAVAWKKLQYAYRVAILLPAVAPGVVGLLIWKYIYDPTSGLLISLLREFGIVGQNTIIDWLGNPKTVIPSIVFMGFPWIGGTSVLIYMSGIMNISTEVIEASQLDGANVFRRIWFIDIPLLMGQIRFFVIFGLIGGLQDFGIQIVLTHGGPGYSTYVPAYYMFIEAFTAGRMGYASTIGVVIFSSILMLSLIALKYFKTEMN